MKNFGRFFYEEKLCQAAKELSLMGCCDSEIMDQVASAISELRSQKAEAKRAWWDRQVDRLLDQCERLGFAVIDTQRQGNEDNLVAVIFRGDEADHLERLADAEEAVGRLLDCPALNQDSLGQKDLDAIEFARNMGV